MVQQDKIEIEKADAKNSVEEYVYDMREKIYTIYEKFISEEVHIHILHTVVTQSTLLSRTGERYISIAT